MIFGTWLGTFAPWADHTRIGPNHLWWYLQPFLSIIVIQIFFLGSLFFAVAALTRKIFVVYLQGVALFMIYIIGITVFFATRSLEHFWSGILDPDRAACCSTTSRATGRWSRRTRCSCRGTSRQLAGRVSVQPPALDAVGLVSLVATVGALPDVGRSAHRASQGKRRAAKARMHGREEARPMRSLVAAQLAAACTRSSAPRTTFAQYLSLTRLRIRNILREIPFWAIVGLLIAFAINNG